jgi:hypothetical protein
MRYSDHEQRQMDIASGQELDRHAERRTIQCVGSSREPNEPIKFDLRVHGGGDAFCNYRLTIDEAIKLRRELTDFLALQNVPCA